MRQMNKAPDHTEQILYLILNLDHFRPVVSIICTPDSASCRRLGRLNLHPSGPTRPSARTPEPTSADRIGRGDEEAQLLSYTYGSRLTGICEKELHPPPQPIAIAADLLNPTFPCAVHPYLMNPQRLRGIKDDGTFDR
jgi:hypothetical protein